MKSSMLLESWGREILREQGFVVDDVDSISLDLTTEGSGCCDMCYSTSAVIEITSGSGYRTTVSYL